MAIATEPIGSIPRPTALRWAVGRLGSGGLGEEDLEALYADALRDTIERFEATGSPVITDGAQRGSRPFTGPLTGGPFRYERFAATDLAAARTRTHLPVKQAVVAASTLSLLYPSDGLDGYAREEFLADLVDEAAADVKRCLAFGADSVQLDVAWDPAHGSVKALVELDNEVLDRFTHEDRQRIGAYVRGVSPEQLPELFSLQVGRLLLPLATAEEPRRVLDAVKLHARPDQRVFVGVTDPSTSTVESPALVRDRVLLAAEYVEPARLGTCDDGGFDADGARDVAFAKIQARVEGTHLAADVLGA